MNTRSEIASCFKTFHRMVMTQFNSKIRIFDVIMGWSIKKVLFKVIRVIMELFTKQVVLTHQPRVTERKNRHLLEVARLLMSAVQVPKAYWGSAVPSVAYLMNRMPLNALELETLLELLQGTFSYIVSPKLFWLYMLCFEH